MYRPVVALAVASLLCGCAATAYKTQVDTMATAANSLVSSIPSEQDLTAADRDAVSDEAIRELMLGVKTNAPVTFYLGCEDAAYMALSDYVGHLQDHSDTGRDRAYAAFAANDARACIATVDDFSDADARAGTKPVAGRTNAATQTDVVSFALQKQTQGDPDCLQPAIPNCKLEDYTKALSDYAANLQSIADGKSVEQIDAALKGANTSTDALVKATTQSPIAGPIADAVFAITNLAVQQAQYTAMLKATRRFNEVWPSVCDPMKTVARLRYARLIHARASQSLNEAVTAQLALNTPAMYRDAPGRLALYLALSARVTSAASAYNTARRVDPGRAIDAFGDSNAALEKALQDPKTQFSSLVASVQVLQAQAQAIAKATGASNSGAKPAGG